MKWTSADLDWYERRACVRYKQDILGWEVHFWRRGVRRPLVCRYTFVTLLLFSLFEYQQQGTSSSTANYYQYSDKYCFSHHCQFRVLQSALLMCAYSFFFFFFYQWSHFFTSGMFPQWPPHQWCGSGAMQLFILKGEDLFLPIYSIYVSVNTFILNLKLIKYHLC